MCSVVWVLFWFVFFFTIANMKCLSWRRKDKSQMECVCDVEGSSGWPVTMEEE